MGSTSCWWCVCVGGGGGIECDETNCVCVGKSQSLLLVSSCDCNVSLSPNMLHSRLSRPVLGAIVVHTNQNVRPKAHSHPCRAVSDRHHHSTP